MGNTSGTHPPASLDTWEPVSRLHVLTPVIGYSISISSHQNTVVHVTNSNDRYGDVLGTSECTNDIALRHWFGHSVYSHVHL